MVDDYKIDTNTLCSIISIQKQTDDILGMIDRANTNCSVGDLLQDFYKPYTRVKVDYASSHKFRNQFQFISSLYTYLILPKEIIFNSICENQNLEESKKSFGFTSDHPIKYHLRRLRNAIAHGNIRCSEDNGFTFTDITPRHENDRYQISLSNDQAVLFCDALARAAVKSVYP